MDKDQDALEGQLEEFVEELRQLSIIVQDYHVDSNDVLISKLYSTFTCLLSKINTSAQQTNKLLPKDLMEIVDKGENPNPYLVKVAESIEMHGLQTSAKIDAYRTLQQRLDQTLKTIVDEGEERAYSWQNSNLEK